MKTKSIVSSAASIIGLLMTGHAHASAILYPHVGLQNPIEYIFTATSTGALTAYFAGSTASYDEHVQIVDVTNGTSVIGLDDHSSAVGASISLAVNAGDVIVFKDIVNSSGNTWSNVISQNVDGGNHVYSTAYNSGDTFKNGQTLPPSLGVASGTYVAFEDLRFPSSDFNYYDDTFVFTNVSTALVNVIPEPTTIALLASSLLVFCVSRRKANQA